MIRSFFNAISGMNSYRTWMDITADNLANINTIGFKGSRPIFQDVISSVIVGVNPVANTLKATTYGAGVVVDSTQRLWTIGNFKQTGINTDLAIQGRGLFIVRDPTTNMYYYTRDGQFRLNKEGFLINTSALKLQAFKLDEKGKTVGTAPEDVYINPQLNPKSTNIIKFLQPTNLDASASVINIPFDPNNPISYNYKYTITIYDSLGTPYQADIFFAKRGANTWSIYLVADLNSANAGYEIQGKWENVQFDEYGRLIFDDNIIKSEPSLDGKTVLYYLNPDNNNLTISLIPPIPSGGVFENPSKWRIYIGEAPKTNAPQNNQPIPNPYITQYFADFIVTAEQNGYAKGDLIDVFILSEDGTIVGVYSNGKSLPLYRVALAVFSDTEELIKKGANLYTSLSTPTIMTPGESEKIRPGMLEMSNVDIAAEFINLISAQRSYQANARIIASSNTVLDEIVNLVR